MAGEDPTIRGRISDSVSGQGIPFAQVALKHAMIGTSANGDGVFVFTFPALFLSDTLVISALGFARYSIPVMKLMGQPADVRLKPDPVQLPEVEIVSFTPEEVIRRVVAAIPENYGRDSVVLTAFVRSQKYVAGRLAEFTEAIIDDLKTGYYSYPQGKADEKQRESNIPRLVKGRVISDTALVERMGEVGRSAGCLGCNFIHDMAEFPYRTVLDESMFRYYTFTMKEVHGPEGKRYQISFDQRPGVKEQLWKGELVVNASDFALLRVVQRPSFNAYDTYEKNKMKRMWEVGSRGGWIKEMPLMEWTVTYDRRGGRYVLSTIRVENWLTFTYPPTGERLKLSTRNEVVVTAATSDRTLIREFRGDKTTGVHQRWDQVVGEGDRSFWDGYNYLPVEQKLEEMVKGLGRTP